MTALDPVASKLPGRTGVRCPGQGAPSERKMTVGHDFLSGNQPDQGTDRDLPYQFRLALALSGQLCYGRGQPGGAIWEKSVEIACVGILNGDSNGHS